MTTNGFPYGFAPRTSSTWPRRGALLRLLRMLYGITQRGLGEQLGVRNETVSRWESQGYTPHPAYRRQLALSFNAPELAEEDWHKTTVPYTEAGLRKILPSVRAALSRAAIDYTEEHLDRVVTASFPRKGSTHNSGKDPKILPAAVPPRRA